MEFFFNIIKFKNKLLKYINILTLYQWVIIIVQSNMKPKYFCVVKDDLGGGGEGEDHSIKYIFSLYCPFTLYQNEFEIKGKDSSKRVTSLSIVCLTLT
jgi:hypothetical protein